MNRVSVVVPVYNTPKEWLIPCVNSAVNQRLCNLEIVIVDDGSDESIALLCDDIARAHPGMVKTIHQENKGLSGARNTGIKSCSGDFVYLLDSDDELASETAISSMLELMSQQPDVEMVIGSFHFPGGSNASLENEILTGQDCLALCLEQGNGFPAQDILFSKGYLAQMDRLFVEGLVHEDEEFTPRAIFGAKYVVLARNLYTYNRIEREGTITTARDEVSVFRRCRGKLIVAAEYANNPLFEWNSIPGKRNRVRAFSFANMAFRAWANEIHSDNFQQELTKLACGVNYSSCPLLMTSAYYVRTWLCIQAFRILGIKRYLNIIRRLDRRN